ncbi:hypothetical protein BZA77DRAFT_355295 [Pyronema omphalodes]|nr:hypothetical protein BZA77DRAFT_355295 [Pyronema omphalodes]
MQTTVFTLLSFLLATVSALPAAPAINSPTVTSASPNTSIPGNTRISNNIPISKFGSIVPVSTITMPATAIILAFLSKPFSLLTIDQVNEMKSESGITDIQGPGTPGCPACSGLPPAEVKEANDNFQNLAHWTDRFCAQKDLDEETVNGHCKEWAETTTKYKGNTVYKTSGCPEMAWFC